jgi:hypothetical protein
MDWELFQRLASEFISPSIKILSHNEADKAACDFAASTALAYRLSTRKITIIDRKYKILGPDRLLKHKRKLRKLWQETRNPAYKAAVNWVTQNIRRMIQKKALERWETKLANCEITPQEIWPIVKSLTKRGGPKAPSAIHGPLGLILYPNIKATIIAVCLEKQFRAHDLCDCDHSRYVEVKVKALTVALISS